MPANWPKPTYDELVANYYPFDFVPAIGKCGALEDFSGEVGEYPGWQKNFVEMVHVQNVPVCHKVRALDKHVAEIIKKRLFRNLGSTVTDYVTRIERLEREFGGNDRQITYFTKQLSQISQVKIGGKFDDLVDSEHDLSHFLGSTQCEDPQSPWLANLVLPFLQTETSQKFEEYCQHHAKTPNLLSLRDYFRMLIVCQRNTRARANPEALWASKKKPDTKEEKKPPKAQAFSGNMKSETDSDSDQEGSRKRQRAKRSKQRLEDDASFFATFLSTQKCAFCTKEGHNIFSCEDFFANLTGFQREKWALDSKRCFGCLDQGHSLKECTRKKNCRHCMAKGVEAKHNSVLHVAGRHYNSDPKEPDANVHVTTGQEEVLDEESSPLEDEDSESPPVESQMFSQIKPSKALRRAGVEPAYPISLAQGVVKIRNPENGKEMHVNTLADDCATHITLDEEIADLLGMEGPRRGFTVGGQGGHHKTYSAFKKDLEILSPTGDVVARAKTYCYDRPIGDLHAHNWEELKHNWEHLRNLNIPKPVGNGRLHMIIGSQHAGLLASKKEHHDPNDLSGPVARETLIGTFCFGKTEPDSDTEDDQEEEEEEAILQMAYVEDGPFVPNTAVGTNTQ